MDTTRDQPCKNDIKEATPTATNVPRTSTTHPIRVDAVLPDGGWAPVGMSFCPGKKQTGALTGDWDRNLDLDLARIREWGPR